MDTNKYLETFDFDKTKFSIGGGRIQGPRRYPRKAFEGLEQIRIPPVVRLTHFDHFLGSLTLFSIVIDNND